MKRQLTIDTSLTNKGKSSLQKPLIKLYMLYLCTPPSLLTQKAPCMRPRIKAKIAPDQKFVTLNHDTSPSVSWIMSTVTINPTIPKVRKFRGILTKRKSSQIVAFTKLSTTATTMAVHKLATVIPGTINAAIAMAIAPTRIFNRNFMIIRVYMINILAYP